MKRIFKEKVEIKEGRFPDPMGYFDELRKDKSAITKIEIAPKNFHKTTAGYQTIIGRFDVVNSYKTCTFGTMLGNSQWTFVIAYDDVMDIDELADGVKFVTSGYEIELTF